MSNVSGNNNQDNERVDSSPFPSDTEQRHGEGFTVTPKAGQKIREKLQKRRKGVGIRVKVKRTGCSGLAYELAFVDTKEVGDYQFSVPGSPLYIYVDGKSWPYVKGCTLDYTRQGINEGFEFINPNEKGRCGCGESFIV